MENWKNYSTEQLNTLLSEVTSDDIKTGTPRRQRRKVNEAIEKLNALFGGESWWGIEPTPPSASTVVTGDNICSSPAGELRFYVDELETARLAFMSAHPNADVDTISLSIEAELDDDRDFRDAVIARVRFQGSVPKDKDVYDAEYKQYKSNHARYELLRKLWSIRGELNRSTKESDPEYQEFLRLQKKFQKR